MSSKSSEPPELNPRFYTNAELNEIAKNFLKAYNPSFEIPTNVELILEKKFNISISPFPNLKKNFGVEAFLTLNSKTVYVDSELLDLRSNEHRYRFTIAEELAHFILHKDLFTGIRTPEDYLKLYNQMSPEGYKRMDCDAKYLASAILMPTASFETNVTKIYTEILCSGNASLSLHDLQRLLLRKLARLYNVGESACAIRFQELGLEALRKSADKKNEDGS